ncbi:MAG: hypothetical protein WAV50_00555 [Minisyncoccia bacterium]
MNSTIGSALIALIIGGGAGYFMGSSNGGDTKSAKDLQESVVMMKEQAVSIQEMAEMLQANGTIMQTMGMQYKNDDAVSKGKDMMAVGAKYIKADTTAGSETMGKMMQ